MKKILIIISIFFVIISSANAFYDDNEFAWAKYAVDKWSANGYITGYPDGTFKGNQYITKAEVITVINKLNNSSLKPTKRVSKDVDERNWFFGDMGKAVESGLISVDSEGNLYPNKYATREEVMVILSKLLNISYSGNIENARVNKYLDCNEITSNNYKRVAGIVEEGIVNGYSDGRLKPQSNITRAEFVCVLNNAIKEIYTNGKYSKKIIKGNVVINGKNVEITDSEIEGKVFVLDGAKNGEPNLVNTRISKGINSRVGKVLVDFTDNLQTVSEYNDNNPKEFNELPIAKLSYSESGWTNEEVDIKVKFDIENVELIKGNRITAEKNGEYEIEYLYDGKIRKIVAVIDNIDTIKPNVTATVETMTDYSIINVEYSDDGLSPISKIVCGNLVNKRNKETNTIDNMFNILKSGEYVVEVIDEAGNIGTTTVEIPKIERNLVANYEVKNGKATITASFSNSEINPIVEIICSNGAINKIDANTGILANSFDVTENGFYTITTKDKGGNIEKVQIKIDGI